MLSNILIAAKRLARLAPVLAAVIAGTLLSGPAQAQWHHRGYWGGPRVGVYFGPGYYPGYYYPPAYYGPPVVVAPAAPPTYVEQGGGPAMAEQAPQQSSMWYYCPASRSYYPYVKECAGGWQQVAPSPAPPQ